MTSGAEDDYETPQSVRPVITDETAVVTRSSRTLNMELTCPVCLARPPRLPGALRPGAPPPS